MSQRNACIHVLISKERQQDFSSLNPTLNLGYGGIEMVRDATAGLSTIGRVLGPLIGPTLY